MKNNLKLAVLIIVAAVVAASCGGNKKEMLIKKWQWTEFSSPEMDAKIKEAKAALDTITDPSMKSMAESSVKMMDGMMEDMKKTTMEFKKDGSYDIHINMMGMDQTETGKWDLTSDGKTLVMTDSKGKTDSSAVEIAADKVVFTLDAGGDKASITMVPAK